MQIQTMTYYIQTNVTCAVILGYLIIKSRRTFRMSTEERLFARLIINTLIYSLSDVFTWYADGKNFPAARFVVYAANIVYIVYAPIMSYMWADYVLCKVGNVRAYKNALGKIHLGTIIILTVLTISTPLTNFSFSVDAANSYHRGVGAYCSPIIAWVFILLITASFATRASKSELMDDRENFGLVLQFIVPVLICSILQLVIYGTSLIQVGFTISLIIVFINRQQTQISIDELTGLNNRREFEKYVEKLYGNGGSNICMCLIDADNFKKINDEYGHIEGDIALKTLGGMIKGACNDLSAHWFIARYGGDEFVIIGVDKTETDVNELREALNRQQDRVNSENTKPYPVRFSFGYKFGTIKNKEDRDRLIEQADIMMYEDKAVKKGTKRNGE